MLVPAVAICASMDDCAPVPRATIVMTAATPMIMPSMVNAVRILLRPSAFSAMRKIIRTAIYQSPVDRFYLNGRLQRQRRELFLGVPSAGDRVIRDHVAVAE